MNDRADPRAGIEIAAKPWPAARSGFRRALTRLSSSVLHGTEEKGEAAFEQSRDPNVKSDTAWMQPGGHRWEHTNDLPRLQR
jgi:hypothetical protein